MNSPVNLTETEDTRALKAALGTRTIVLVGMMGAGKTSIGKRLAQRLGIPFNDADAEIERAAGMTIPEIFSTRGEAEFRLGEQRVITRCSPKRNSASPRVEKISGMVMPAARSISASASLKGMPKRCANLLPIDVFPAPIMPTSTIVRVPKAALSARVSSVSVRFTGEFTSFTSAPGHCGCVIA